MNYNGRINLLKLKNVGILTVKGREANKKCVVIPIEDNNLFISADENLKAKAAYIDFIAWENQSTSKYGDTHSIRQSLSKEIREKMTDDELKSIPYFGNLKPYEAPNASTSVSAPVASISDDDDLPF